MILVIAYDVLVCLPGSCVSYFESKCCIDNSETERVGPMPSPMDIIVSTLAALGTSWHRHRLLSLKRRVSVSS